MKLFNKGARAFKFHGKDILPDQFTDLTATIAGDATRQKQAEKLLVDYPNELLAGESASADAKAAIGRAAQLEKENATLKAQVDKLQKLLVSTDATASETALAARAEKAEARVAELEAELEKARTPSEAARVLNASPDHAPKAEKSGKKTRNIDTPAGS